MEDCLFCKIAAGIIPSDKVYEDEQVLAFKDIAPQAPVHVIVIPKEHFAASIAELTEAHASAVAHIILTLPRIADKLGLDGGYRVVTNCGKDAGQTVQHLHFHILGGKTLGELA